MAGAGVNVEIVAELAQGFEGRPDLARLLMRATAAAGADAAKYQLVYADELATPDYKHFALFRALEMPDDIWVGLAEYARELGIQLHLDIFGSRSLDLASRLGVAAIKLHGTDIANTGLLEQVAACPVRRVLLGAGGAHDSEVGHALTVLSSKRVVVLLGFQGYPTPTESNQIARVRALSERLARVHSDAAVGFADHASPDSPLRFALAATAIGAGARVIEKHLTLAKIMKLEDHESALDPDEFAAFVRVVRDCAAAMGAPAPADDYGMSEPEKQYRAMIRRHVVAGRALPRGSAVSPADLVLKRTSAAGAVTDLTAVYRRALRRDVGAGQPIVPEDLE